MKKILSFLLLSIIISNVNCQFNTTIFSTPNTETGQSFKLTDDNGYVITGSTNNDLLITKYTNQRLVEWSFSYRDNINSSERGNSIIQCSDGGYLVVGNRGSTGLIIKTAPNGTLEWSKSLNIQATNQGLAAIQSSVAPVEYTVVFRSSEDGESWRSRVLQLDAEGDFVRARSFNANSNHLASWFNNLSLSNENGLIFTGNADAQTADEFDFWVAHTDRNLNVLWSRCYGSSEDDGANEVIREQNGYTIAGVTRFGGSQNMDFALINIQNNGSLNWCTTYGTNNDERSFSAKLKPGGGYVLTGYRSAAVGNQPLIVNTNVNRDIIFDFLYSDENDFGVGNSIEVSQDSIFDLGSLNNNFYVNRFSIQQNSLECDFTLVRTNRTSKNFNALSTSVSNALTINNTNFSNVILTRANVLLNSQIYNTCIALSHGFSSVDLRNGEIGWNYKLKDYQDITFVVEKSIDGINFEKVSFVQSPINSFKIESDRIFYYRIHAVDDDIYSPIVISNGASELNIYLNELKQIVVNTAEHTNISLTTIDGKVLKTLNTNENIVFDNPTTNCLIILNCITDSYKVKSFVILSQ